MRIFKREELAVAAVSLLTSRVVNSVLFSAGNMASIAGRQSCTHVEMALGVSFDGFAEKW